MKTELKKSKKWSVSKTLNISAIVVAILGVAALANNIYLFVKTVKQYVAQGYPVATVTTQLLSSQLLPGVFEPIAVYGGIAILLLAVKMINEKVSKCLEFLAPAEVSDNVNDAIKEDIVTSEEDNVKQNSVNIENEEKDEKLQASKA